MAKAKKQDQRITVVEVEAKNFHRLEVAEVKVDGERGVVRVTGKNRAGKTSLLRAIRGALGGAGGVLGEAVVKEGAEDGTGEVTLTLSNGYTVRRRFTPQGPDKGYLTLDTPEGLPVKSGVQTFLDGWAGPLSFDPIAFFDLKPDRQREVLLGLSDDPGLLDRVNELRARQKEVYDERTEYIREERRWSKLEAPEGERPVVPDLGETMSELNDLLDKDRTRRNLQEQQQRHEEEIVRQGQLVRELEARLAAERDKLADMKKTKVENDELLEATPDLSARIDELQALAQGHHAAQEALKPWERYDDAMASLQEARARKAELTAQIDALKEEETKAIADAGIAVDGISFDDDGAPLLNGQPLSVASGAERVRMAVSVAMAANPQLRVCLVDQGDDLDLEELEAVQGLADEHDFQIWLARIGLEGDGEVVVVDGVATTGVRDDG